ncbi:conserved hypothetical protein [uncultured Alphaproteobacteria bacterium]|uniref:Uncharacterized protein n=1 Tax=uncultured Alphaproteobacteria bacterium TaxID=91750 RepID=A0A212JVP7_9PROT|nr:conserved hypothetical protein [uncultured Alphaproteobacteria bacterium]
MTPEEFRALLETYGADLTRWPHGARQGALRLLEASETARDAFAEAQAFDDVLRVREPALPPAARRRLTDAILDNLPDDPAPMPRQFRPLPHPVLGIGALVLRPLAPLWAGCLGLGLALGIGLYLAQPHPAAVRAQAQSGWIETWAMYGR